jgi:hypothetical protein
VDRNPYAELKAAKEALAKEKARADDNAMMLYDRYMVASIQGICARPQPTWYREIDRMPGHDEYGRPRGMTASEIVAEAESITFACLRARDLYNRGLSPHESPEPGVPPSVAAI